MESFCMCDGRRLTLKQIAAILRKRLTVEPLLGRNEMRIGLPDIEVAVLVNFEKLAHDLSTLEWRTKHGW